ANSPPTGEAAQGLHGVLLDDFEEGFGKAMLMYKGREYEVRAGDMFWEADGENTEPMREADAVICVVENDGFYFVAKPEQIYKGIDTKF
ncbi:MAG: hypothetical protein FWD35_06240, partial [Oscillospiraceae bacterium]|nr:hypothetical protein [Oscillospiraceae bacterium]